MSTCSICGTTTTLSSSVCPVCAPDEFAMIPVERRNSTGPCSNEISDCEDTDKWYDLTTAAFTIPNVEATTEIPVCDPSRYAVGQWISVIGAGIFYVTAINESTITVRNSCSDGTTPIDGNLDPATIVSSGAKIYVVDEPGWPRCLSDSGVCSETVACLAAEEDICFSSVANAGEEVHPLMVGTEDDFCARKLPSIYAKENALGYSARSSIGGTKTVTGGTLTAKQFVVQDFASKLDQPLAVPNSATGFWKYIDGDLTFIDGGQLFIPVYGEILNESGIALTSGSTSHVTSVLPSFPAGASQVMLHVQAYAVTSVSNDLFVFKIKIGGRDVLIYGGNEQYDSDPAIVRFPGHNDNIAIIPISSNAALTVNNEVVDATIGGVLDLKAWVLGYFV